MLLRDSCVCHPFGATFYRDTTQRQCVQQFFFSCWMAGAGEKNTIVVWSFRAIQKSTAKLRTIYFFRNSHDDSRPRTRWLVPLLPFNVLHRFIWIIPLLCERSKRIHEQIFWYAFSRPADSRLRRFFLKFYLRIYNALHSFRGYSLG